MTNATPATRKTGRKPKELVAAAAAAMADKPTPTPVQRGGARANAGRKSAAVEAGSAQAHVLYSKARANKEAFQAKLAELEYNVKSGQYVAREEMREANATAFATIAQALRSIPDNLERKHGVTPEIAEAIGQMIDIAMEDLADELKRIHEANNG